ncbi:MAG: lysylphosphatidylglycerol synthase transmembrane domain-containing protein [Bdellovibrionota bacterium]
MQSSTASNNKLKLIAKLLPWIITVLCIYLAFRDIDWSVFFANIGQTNKLFLLLAVILTIISYFVRAFRWKFLFPDQAISYKHSVKVLFLGFFMNNLLPARAGELVRAHFGAKVTKQKRTLVLGTIASERLADGLTISFLFTLFGWQLSGSGKLNAMFYVSGFFALVILGVFAVLTFKDSLFKIIDKITEKFDHKASDYTNDRIQTFINSLSPVCSLKTAPRIALWSLIIWLIELFVYWAVINAFGATLSVSLCVLFLAAVNFSSLIPAAPGGIGVIEALASAVLVSAGIDKELALAMVMVQHIIQILVVGIAGAWVMAQWRIGKEEIEEASDGN